MPEPSSQEFLFQRIKEFIPPQSSLVDTVAEILHCSSDSAYRRIRGETPLVMEEARQLCVHFQLSLDQLFQIRTESVLFHHSTVNSKDYDYEKFLLELQSQLQEVSHFLKKEIIYCTKDMPVFHNFYYRPLIAFRYFFWMKSLLQHPDFMERSFSADCLPASIETVSRELTRLYTLIPSVEIWNTECINAVISQVEFYRDSGYFESAADIREIYDAIEATVLHIRQQAEEGVKFLPGDNPSSRRKNFRFYYNRVLLGDNIILVTTDQGHTVFLNYGALNYISTHDQLFCETTWQSMQNLMKKGTIISETSERQRNIFFNILLGKLEERKKHL